ncbi:MAG: CPBP family intramembrane metalloprotease [Anaerolineales bacterium]|nr:CPBP family intramembrane metalloprotease [Anaerolineales bacterium]
MNDPERKKTIWYVVIFSLLIVAVTFIAPLLGGSLSKPGPGVILWGMAPMLVALLMRTVTHDWSDAGFNPAIRKNVRWYIFIILASSVMVVLLLLVGTMTSYSSVSGFSMAPYLKMVLPGMAVFFITATFEEVGWRGYMVPKLASIGINTYLAYAIGAVVWATWHLPYLRELAWVSSVQEDVLSSIPRLYLMFFAYSILYNEIRLITGSVWSAVLFHSFVNAIQHPLAAEYLKIVPGQEYLISFSGLFMIAFVGILGIALNRWRMRNAGLPKSFTLKSSVAK